MNKRSLALLLTAAMLLCAAPLTGLAENSEYPDLLTISIMGQGDGPVDMEKAQAMVQIGEIMNIEFEPVYVERNQLKELLGVRAASGDLPDCMWLVDGAVYPILAEQGALAAIPEELIQEYAPNAYKYTTEAVGEGTWNLLKYDGVLYGWPDVFLNSAYPFVPIIRDDWMEALGFDKFPETIDEAEEIFYAFADYDPTGTGEKVYALSDKGMNTVFGAYGGLPFTHLWKIDKETDTIIPISTMPAMKEALERLAKWYQDGLIDPDFVTGENQEQYWGNTVSFWNGKIGFTMPGMYYHTYGILNPNDETDVGSTNYINFKEIQGEEATYASVKPFEGPYGDAGGEIWGVVGGMPGICFGVQVEDEPEKMIRILQMIEKQATDLEFYELAQVGVEGYDYVRYDEDLGKYVKPEERVGQDAFESNAYGLSVCGAGIYRTRLDFFNQVNVPKFEAEYREQFLDWPGYMNPIRTSLPSQADYQSGLQAAIKEYYYGVVTGAKSLDDWDSFVASLDQLGMQTLLAEANDWYDAFQGR